MSNERFEIDGVQVSFTPIEDPKDIGSFEGWVPDTKSGVDGLYGTAAALASHMIEAGRFIVAAQCILADGRDAAWMEWLEVDPARRKAGLASRILKGTLAAMRRKKIGQIWLAASPERSEQREALLQLYRRHGFDLVPEACRDRRRDGTTKDIMAASLEE
jgi:GNAT superfamily N-acetyltransferase